MWIQSAYLISHQMLYCNLQFKNSIWPLDSVTNYHNCVLVSPLPQHSPPVSYTSYDLWCWILFHHTHIAMLIYSINLSYHHYRLPSFWGEYFCCFNYPYCFTINVWHLSCISSCENPERCRSMQFVLLTSAPYATSHLTWAIAIIAIIVCTLEICLHCCLSSWWASTVSLFMTILVSFTIPWFSDYLNYMLCVYKFCLSKR